MLKLRTMVDGAEHIGAGLAVNEDDSRITRVGALLRRTSLDELPNLRQRAARRDVADRPPPHAAGAGRALHRPASAGASRSGPGSPAGPRSTAAPRCRGASGSSSTCTTSSTARSALDLRILRRTAGDGAGRLGPLQGRDGRLGGGWGMTPAILLTGVGKRYDIVACFAQLTTTIAADPNPLAPAQYAAHVRAAVPPIDDPAYVPALRELCERHGVGGGDPAHRPRHRGAGARAGRRASCPRSCPRRRSRARRTTSTRPICCSRASGLPSPPTVLPEREPDSYPVMVKPRRGSGARSIHLARDPAREGLLRALRRRGGSRLRASR